MKPLTTAIVMFLLAAPPGLADVHDPIVSQLRDQGYSDISVGRTWLGRIVISAERGEVTREVVLNGRTGEILGDHVTPLSLPSPRRNESSGDGRTARSPMGPAVDDNATAADVGFGGDLLDTDTVLGD